MATNALNSVMTMVEAAKSMGADGNQLAVVDTIALATPFLEEGHWEEANDYNSHHFIQVMTEAVGTDSVINVGVAWEVNTTRPVTELIQGLESATKIDTRILRMMRDPETYRRTQEELTLRGLKKAFHDRILYGNFTLTGGNSTAKVSPDQVVGLMPRFNAISGATYNQIQGTTYWPINVISMAGSTSNGETSMYIVKWGPDGVFFTYPRGGRNFITVDDLDLQLVYDGSSNPYKAEVTMFEINWGLCVADWRCVQRICNMDATHKWTSSIMVQALAGLPDEDMSGVVIYVPRTVWIWMSQEALSNTNSFHFDDAPWGRKTIYFQDIPIRLCDRIQTVEPVVS